jgi:hypothetical protein
MSDHEHELPPDPDLDDLPDEIAEAEGSADVSREASSDGCA